MLHKNPAFQIYFGSVTDQIFPAVYLQNPVCSLIEQEPYKKLKKVMQIDAVTFLRQVHSIDGAAITYSHVEQIPAFTQEGDFLVTVDRGLGIGIMTADCLPIIIYDSLHHTIGVAHAGWKGSIAGIASALFAHMQKQYQTQIDHVQIFFGPSAKSCCYAINLAVVEPLKSFSFVDRILLQRNSTYYFDLPGFNRCMLENLGIKKEAFHVQYNACTICDDQFYSYRRQGINAGRQMTVVCLT